MKIGQILIILVFLVAILNLSSAMSNESLESLHLIDKAKQEILEMQDREIPILRVQESYEKAQQLYSAQMALENTGKIADYDLVNEYATKVTTIKIISLNAKDELQIFLDTYEAINKKIDLSAMDNEYNSIINSFGEERFEDVLELIDLGYNRISEIQSSQTNTKLFYSSTYKTILNFLIKNKTPLSIIFFVIIIFWFIFRITFKKIIINRKIGYLHVKKQIIEKLIKNSQKEYFKDKKTSNLEYKIKLKKFTEIILDIDRQIPLLKEEKFKFSKKEIKNKKRYKRKHKLSKQII